MATIYVRQDLN